MKNALTATEIKNILNADNKVFTANRNSTDNVENAVWLQYTGWVPAITASEIVPGTVMVWNGGSVSVAVEIVKETAKMVTVKTAYYGSFGADKGEVKYFERKFNKARLVAVANKESNK